MFEFIVI